MAFRSCDLVAPASEKCIRHNLLDLRSRPAPLSLLSETIAAFFEYPDLRFRDDQFDKGRPNCFVKGSSGIKPIFVFRILNTSLI
jgi:hypothetical protein